MSFIKILRYIINLFTIIIIIIGILFSEYKSLLWDLSLYSVFLLMIIRPLTEFFPSLKLQRFLILRKNLGIFSASIVVLYAFIHYYNLGFLTFINQYFSLNFWSFKNNLFWAHLGELSGFILLITSNKFSMKLLKRNWKRIQKLSYLYFFSGAWYVFIEFDKVFGLFAIIIVFELTLIAYIKKRIIVEENNISWKWR